eukprot:TRINITY_DN1997_c0_g1_i30.p1 TRINITY_DN1997_c0_g1~~TRINITY_DN1997_c0_g1_i30.p1  ORF type:complete len:283 (+),score=57.59 TRINITY_DN1997_c0_g1_i30:51-899(+)
MLSLFFTFLLVVCQAQLSMYTTSFSQTGEGTYYGGTNNGHCSISPLPTWTSNMVKVAMNSINYASGQASIACGMCVQIQGTGTGSGANPITGPYLAYVYDECPSCSTGDIDFGTSGDGRWGINWRAVDCPVGTDKIAYSWQGANNYYIKIQPRATKIPVQTLEIKNSNGQTWVTAQRETDNFFICPGCVYPIVWPLQLRLTGINNEVLLDNVSSIGTVVNGDRAVQFTGTGVGATSTATPTPATTGTWAIPSLGLKNGGSTIPSTGSFSVTVGYTVAEVSSV